jgi:Do/DeqQ family serine protease
MQDLFKKFTFLVIVVIAFFALYRFFAGPIFKKEGRLGGEPVNRKDLLKADRMGRLISEIADQTTPSVVFVRTEQTQTRGTIFGQVFKFRQEGAGAGIIISKKGHVVTNAHVIRDAEKITVILNDKKEYPAELTGLDTLTDVAVVKIRASKVTAATFGDSDSLEVGQWVVAVGSPMGLFNSVTFGIVSALGRNMSFSAEGFEDFIQTDASINPGNSGGPLLDLDGRVVGMNTMIYSPSGGNVGIGFAIPVNNLRWVASSIIKKGHVSRGWLGVELQALDQSIVEAMELESLEGALVSKVLPETPAERAGLAAGDVILKYDRKDVKTIYQLKNLVARTVPGRKVKIRVLRNGGKTTLTAAIGGREGVREHRLLKKKKRRKIKAPRSYRSKKLGMTVEEITTSEEAGGGVRIVSVEDEHRQSVDPAPGDIVRKIGPESVRSMRDFRKAEKRVDRREEVLVLLSRGGSLFYTSITTR